jgi:penicillin-binding protein-related factor A (putative recombinase)
LKKELSVKKGVQVGRSLLNTRAILASVKPSTRKEINDAAKAAEKEVALVLSVLKRDKGLVFERIPDSKTAGVGKGGNLIAARRGDFDGIGGGRYFIIEVKNSTKHVTFKGMNIKSHFRPSQLAAAVNWGGQGALCLSLLRNTYGEWYSLLTSELCKHLKDGHASLKTDGSYIGGYKSLTNYLEMALLT